jgi:hypothetical protein
MCREYIVGKMAALSGRQIQRLPPYHHPLNPTEIIWNKINSHTTRNTKSFILCYVQDLDAEIYQL